MVASPLTFQVQEPQRLGARARGAEAEKVISGRVVLGDQRGSTAVEVERIRLGRRGLVFQFPWALEAGRHAWVELTLPTGKRIRPLVCVLQTSEGGVSARFVHLFPEHRRALDAALSSPTGY
ncbi:MAG TPA: hypothetical protein PK095_23955 [Myxococcota bacterium]|nr:hypothetical protein [Myxococcota bacterium]